jgi:hypothetical protein
MATQKLPVILLLLLQLLCFKKVIFAAAADCFDGKYSKPIIDSIFTGKIFEFSRQNSAALIEIKRVYKGDVRFEDTFAMVENLQNNFCHLQSMKEKNLPPKFKIGDTRLFLTEKLHYGVYDLRSPLVPITLTNLRKAERIYGSARRRSKSRGPHKTGMISITVVQSPEDFE